MRFKINIHKDNESFIRIIKVAVILLGVAFYAYYGIYKMLFVHLELVGNDFLKGYFAASNFVQGDPIYAMPKGVNPYFYFPLTVLVSLPFVNLQPNIAVLAWFALTHLIILSSGFLLYLSGSSANKLNSAVAIVMALFFSMPLYQNVISGNINILIFGGICLICCFALSGRKNWIPLILAFCTTIKIYPALLMATFVKRRDYRACISFCFFTFLLAVLSIGIFGLSTHLVFSHGLPSATKFIGVFHSMSFTFILKLFLGDSNKNIVFIANLFFLVLLLLSWWQIARKYPAPRAGDPILIVDLFIIILIMIIIFPSSWLMYHALLIPSFYFILFVRLENAGSLKYFSIFIALMFLINFWEIIAYHLPLSSNGLTIHDIGKHRENFPTLYPFLFSIPFVLNMLYLLWLLNNYTYLKNASDHRALNPI